MTNSRAKGAAGEREFANWLKDRGYEARRGQQFSGSPDSPDVVCPSLSAFNLEVKRVERFRLYPSLEQSEADSGPDQTPVVVHRMNRKDWVVVMKADDFLKLVEDRLPF